MNTVSQPRDPCLAGGVLGLLYPQGQELVSGAIRFEEVNNVQSKIRRGHTTEKRKAPLD